MAQDHPSDGKRKRLRQQSNFNPHAEKVTDPLFEQDEFFDPCDLMQVKYDLSRLKAPLMWRRGITDYRQRCIRR